LNHDRTVGLVILADVFKAKPFGEIRIKLNGTELPDAANCILDLDVDFRAVKCSLTLDPWYSMLRAV